MIRVLQLGMTDNLGGIETYLVNYYKNINKEKIQFDFINIYNNKLCFQDEIEKMGANVYKLSNYYKHPFKYIKELKKIIRTNGYEIVHCNMNSAVMLYPLIAAKMAKAKVIIAHSHNSSSDKGFIKDMLHNINKHFIPILANYFFACSKKAGEWFYTNKIINSDNFFIINNAIDVNKYKFDENIRNEKRKELNIKDNELVIGHVGRFSKQKNHTFLIDIYNEIYKQNNNSKLILVGIGNLKEEIEKKVKELNLSKNVLFLGQRNDVEQIMQTMDFFILPSMYEGLPLVGVEAQASGTQCIFANTITEELKLTENTIFLPLELSAKEWAETILKNSKEKTFSSKISTFDDHYDIKVATKALLSIYMKMLKEKGE